MTRSPADRVALSIAPGVLLAGIAGGLAWPILPAVALDRGLSAIVVGVILAANRIGRLVSAPLIGVMTDRLGGRTLLLFGLLCQPAVMGCYLLGVTTSHASLMFMLGRLIHGPATACVFIGAQALALQTGERQQGAAAAGLVKTAMAIGLPLGVLLGALLLSRVGAEGIFGLCIASLVLALAAAWFGAPQHTPPRTTRTALTASLRVAANRQVAAVGCLNFAVTFSALGVVLTLVPLTVGARAVNLMGLGARHSASVVLGLLVLSMGLATAVSSRVARSERAQLLVCLAASVALPLGLVSFGITGAPWAWVCGAILAGLAAGALSASVVSLMAGLLPNHQVGAGVGWLQVCGDLGGIAGPLVATGLLKFGASAAWFGSTGVLLLAILVAVSLAKTSR